MLGDLRIEAGMILSNRFCHIATDGPFSRFSQYLSVAIVGALLLTNPRGRRLSPRPEVGDSHYPPHQSLLWRRSNCCRRILVASRVITPFDQDALWACEVECIGI